MEKWIAFSLNNEELVRMTVEGVFPGEIQETKNLLAYENKCNINDIEVTITE